MAVFLLLLLSASSLFSASFDEVVSLALTASPDAEAAELNHEAMLLDIMEAELDDVYDFSVETAISPLSDGMDSIDVQSLSFSMISPDDNTSLTASVPFSIYYDGSGGDVFPSFSVSHVFDWGYTDDVLEDLQAEALRISASHTYDADRAAIKRSILSLAREILSNECSMLEAEMALHDAASELDDSIALEIVTEGSVGYLELELAERRAEDLISIYEEEESELLARYIAYTGDEWSGISGIPMPEFPDVTSVAVSSALEEAIIDSRIAEEEVLIAESEYNPMRMTAGASAEGGISLGNASEIPIASLYGSVGLEVDDFSIFAEGGGEWDQDLQFIPSLTLLASWRSGNDESEEIALRSLRNNARIRASEASDARRDFEESKDDIANQIMDWRRDWSEMEAEIRYRTALAELSEEKLERGMISADEMDDIATELDVLMLERDILLLDGHILAAEAEELLF